MKRIFLNVLLLVTAISFTASVSRAQWDYTYDDYDYGWGDGYDQYQWWNPADWYEDNEPDRFDSDYNNTWNDYDWYEDDYDWADPGYSYDYGSDYYNSGDYDYSNDRDYGYDYDYGNDAWYDSYDYHADDND